MRINEYETLEAFTNEFVGEWSPSHGHWLGLDFKYNGIIYRLHTGSMYNESDTILPDGRTAMFGIYKISDDNTDGKEYVLIGEYANMDDLLNTCLINSRPFKEIIMDDSTEILGKD